MKNCWTIVCSLTSRIMPGSSYLSEPLFARLPVGCSQLVGAQNAGPGTIMILDAQNVVNFMNKLTAICRALSLKPATSIELAQILGLPQKKIWRATSVLIDGGDIRALKTVDQPMWGKSLRGYRHLRVYEITDRGRMRLSGAWKRLGPTPASYGQGHANRRCAKCKQIYSYLPSAATNGVYDCRKCEASR